MLEVFFLAIALSMDAFAVSIGLGAKQSSSRVKLSLITAGYFGFFQGFMPFLGYWAGKGLLSWIASYAPWIACVLLTVMGIKMIYESFNTDIEPELKQITHKAMLLLAIATSIDAMAAGFVLPLLKVNVAFACVLIAIVTYLFSYAGVLIGAKSGQQLGDKAELLGGIVLILIGLKVLLV
jgi:manganese efflux pump family protein